MLFVCFDWRVFSFLSELGFFFLVRGFSFFLSELRFPSKELVLIEDVVFQRLKEFYSLNNACV